MLLQYPNQSKKKHVRKNINKINICKNFSNLNFEYSTKLIASAPGQINFKQMNAIIFKINKLIKKIGILKFNIFPVFPKTKKPIEVRMGKGKGNIETYIFKIKPGYCICEIHSNQNILPKLALNLIKYKLNFKTKIIQL